MSRTLWLVTVAKTHRNLPCVDNWGIYPDRRTACDEAMAEYPELRAPIHDRGDDDMMTLWAGDSEDVEVTIVACDVGEPL